MRPRSTPPGTVESPWSRRRLATEPDPGAAVSPKRVDDLSADYRALIAELEVVLAPARTCIAHAGNRELARVGTHGFAVTGHLLNVESINRRIAEDWAAHSVP